MALKVKQVRAVTFVLGLVASLLLGILGFRVLGEYLTSRASSSAPQNLAITDITQNSAVIKWTTDQENQIVIEYGTSPTSLTFFAPEATKTKDHRVELNLLTPETTYYFQIKAGDQAINNGGVAWTFTTLKESSATPSPAAETTPEPEASPTAMTEPNETTGTPSLAPSPTTNPADVAKDTNCDLNEYKNRFYTSDAKYDQDNNGTVNLRDWSLCNADKATPTP